MLSEFICTIVVSWSIRVVNWSILRLSSAKSWPSNSRFIAIASSADKRKSTYLKLFGLVRKMNPVQIDPIFLECSYIERLVRPGIFRKWRILLVAIAKPRSRAQAPISRSSNGMMTPF